jgi:hypothetical protein
MANEWGLAWQEWLLTRVMLQSGMHQHESQSYSNYPK